MMFPSIFNDNFTDSIMNDMFEFPFSTQHKLGASSFMNTDIKENENGYQLDLELPGFKKEDIKAELHEGYLVINAIHDESKDEKDKHGKFLRKERYTGTCQRSFFVGENITEKDIKASFENGILKLDIPKVEAIPKVEDRKYIQIEG